MKKTPSKFSEPLRPNTLMGQHFLRSKEVADFIADAAQIMPTETILEIGPGKGILTEKLLARASRVIAIEKDPRLATYMHEHFDNERLEVVEGDVLDVDLPSILPAHYKLVANIPYYITGKILRTFLEPTSRIARPDRVVLMMQHEVARRLTAAPPQMNLLALSVQTFGTPRIVKKISRSYFRPQPEVDSAIIAIENISDDFFTHRNITPKHFFSLAARAFAGKRKKLSNTIGIDSDKRPQHLSLEEWGEVAQKIS